MSDYESPSWGYSFKKIDELFQPIKEKFGQPRYNNFYPFKSASGKWYAFWNDRYSDIKIWDVEKHEIVFTNYYSNLEPKYYAEHTNVSTYVPCYIFDSFELNGKEHRFTVSDYDIDESYDISLDDLHFVPFAFNASTIWGCDYEFYCDVLDLRRIDEGIVSTIKKSYILSRDMNHVRDMIKVETENWRAIRNKDETDEEFEIRRDEDHVYHSVKVLIEDMDMRIGPSGDPKNIYSDEEKYENVTKHPWKLGIEKDNNK
jgi:hypothetical protein